MRDLEYPSYGKHYDGNLEFETRHETKDPTVLCDLCGDYLPKSELVYFHEEMDDEEYQHLRYNEQLCCKQCKKKLEKMLDNYRIS